MTTIVSCPTCGKDVKWKPESQWRPFCSQRCHVIDLGAWAEESYRIPTEDSPAMDHDPSTELPTDYK